MRVMKLAGLALAAGVLAAACSSTPTAKAPNTTSTAPYTSTTTADNAACFQVFSNIGAITTANITPDATQVATNCSPADLKAVATARVEFTANGAKLNAIGLGIAAAAAKVVELAACPSNPHTKLCP